MKPLLFFKSLLLSCLLMGCLLNSCKTDESLGLKIPKEGFEVVQHLPKDSESRDKNSLYLPPRSIKEREFNTPQLHAFIDSMYAVMLRKAGVGIAANQLGKRLQIFIIEAKNDNPRYQVLGSVEKRVFINPVITRVSDTKKNFWHGCLSAQGEKRGNVATFEWIEYTCQDLNGEVRSGRIDGFGAVIFQHEFRHLMGGTYLDHANHFLSRDELNEQIKSGGLPFFEVASDSLPLLLEGYELNKGLEQ